jgi:hypothetical protein
MENQEFNNTGSNGRTGKNKKWILIALAGVLLCLIAYVIITWSWDCFWEGYNSVRNR